MIRKIEQPAKNYVKQIDSKLEYIQNKLMSLKRTGSSSKRPIDSDEEEIDDDNDQIQDDNDDDVVMENDTTTIPYERYSSHYRSAQDRNEQNILERSNNKRNK